MKIKYQSVALFLATTVALSSQMNTPASAATVSCASYSQHKQMTRSLYTEEDVQEIICEIIEGYIGWPSGSVDLDDTFVDDLFVESLTMFNIVSDCEDEFGINYNYLELFEGYHHLTVRAFARMTFELFICPDDL